MLIIWGFTNFQGREVTKKQYIFGIALKRGLGKFAGGLAKNREEGVFEGGRGARYLDKHYDLILVHAGT